MSASPRRSFKMPTITPKYGSPQHGNSSINLKDSYPTYPTYSKYNSPSRPARVSRSQSHGSSSISGNYWINWLRTSLSMRTVIIYCVLCLFFTGLVILFHHIPKDSETQQGIEQHIKVSSQEVKPAPVSEQSIQGELKRQQKQVSDDLKRQAIENNLRILKRGSAGSRTNYQRPPRAAASSNAPSSGRAVDVKATQSPTTRSSVATFDHLSDVASSTGAQSLGRDTMLLIICAKRPDYLSKTLDKIVQYHPGGDSLPVMVSQDGSDRRVQAVIDNFADAMHSRAPDVLVYHVRHPESRERSPNGYFKLAAHYGWALNQVFDEKEPKVPILKQIVSTRSDSTSITSFKRVIILEEDLLIAPDFFELFAGTKELLDNDTSLLAVSAWNDNGMHSAVKDAKQLYRSDFFPGLGWMMPRRIWEELRPGWPKAYWDDWLREPKQRKGRHIIRPEICRTFHIGVKGVSNSQYSEYLNSIHLNDVFVPFTQMDLSYLKQDTWEDWYLSKVRKARHLTLSSARSGKYKLRGHTEDESDEIRIPYDKFEGRGDSYSAVAAWSGAMDNVKAGVPRTAYKGIVSLWKGNTKIHLIPRSFI